MGTHRKEVNIAVVQLLASVSVGASNDPVHLSYPETAVPPIPHSGFRSDGFRARNSALLSPPPLWS